MSANRGGRGANRGGSSGYGGGGGARGGKGGTGGGGVCYKCQKPGHMARDCPLNRQGDGNSGRTGGPSGPPGVGQSTQVVVQDGPQERAGIYGGQPPKPDENITAAENNLVEFTRDKMIDGFPGRRGYGTKGKPTVLRTNYFKVNTLYEVEGPQADKVLYRYDVTTTKEIQPAMKRRLMTRIMQHPAIMTKPFATDFATIIVGSVKLPELEEHPGFFLKDRDVEVPGPNGLLAALTRPETEQRRQSRLRNTVKVSMKYSDSFTLGHIVDALKSTGPLNAAYTGRVDIIQLMNILVCRCPHDDPNIVKAGKNTFYPHAPHTGVASRDLGGGLQGLRGYFVSVRPAINRMLINVNVTSGAFYKPGPLLTLIRDAGFDAAHPSPKTEAFIKSLKVMASYTKDKESKPFLQKKRTIVNFARSPRYGNARTVKFRWENESVPNSTPQQISVYDYFRRQHNMTIKYPELAVINVGTPEKPGYIPMEICNVLPGQPYRRLLQGEQTKQMIEFAARAPNNNATSIAGTASQPGTALQIFKFADESKQPIKACGFTVNPEMLTVPGRILDTPRVTYAKNDHARITLGSWNCADHKFALGGSHGKWKVLVINLPGNRGKALFDTPRQEGALTPDQLFSTLDEYLAWYGIRMGAREKTQTLQLNTLDVTNREHNDNLLRGAFATAQGQGVSMLFIVLPENHRWLYARLKLHGDVKFGIHSICAVGSKLQKVKNQGMFLGNLALKFNIKGGGVSHQVADTLIAPLDKKTMLVGIDVTHPSPGSKDKAPSIAAIVASVDEYLIQWPGSIRSQRGKQEMVDGQNLEEMMLERLDLWYKHNKKALPDSIVIYRDGVSEGQYETSLAEEVPAFERAFAKRYGKREDFPKLAIIIVGKRHHTRFYPTRSDQADYKTFNPLPGTIVDRGIAGKVLREFWLQAHQGLQGTARPAHYVVIKDEIGFEANQMEQITHHLCYLFNRATKAVSICPPAYYADLLCERGRAYLFSTLAEDNTSEDASYDGDSAEWRSGVHRNLEESTWYI